ncbi:37S ribosomal protein S35, mitochondrial [Candida viswanathii]|uniref:37S ribosomal protein S35, mitochondrial n=1 Tax=Candida viswanathii TaxID=5486 RepID=A0A367YLA5_9ASCO|nr:37S ribosomal protein S35, mitochondrial [Candida viswanathii]
MPNHARVKRVELMNKERLLKEARQFLGPKNLKGEHWANRYYFAPRRNRTNYITREKKVLYGQNIQDPTMHPFPHNPYTKTARILSDDTKKNIVHDANVKGYHPQEIAHKYGINLLRVEAVLKLHDVEKSFVPDKAFESDLRRYANTMKNMFPIFAGGVDADNLTEIPTPAKTFQARFLTLEENQPFGPVDAAKILRLEPAADTLRKLTEFNVDQHDKSTHDANAPVDVVYGKVREGDRSTFRFVKKTAGTFGHRYGASRRDTKKDRAIGFDGAGKMVYLHPEQ